VSGVRCAYARFDGYAPRQEPPAFFAGGKVAHFERVEWVVQPDPATAAAALQKNEADWLEQPLIDLCPMLAKSPGCYTKVVDPGGWLMFMVINHLNPPFDNPKIRQAILHVLDQQAFADSVVGDQKELAIVPTGLFAPTMPMANTAGLEHFTAPRDLALARKMVAESGYKGEPVMIMSPSDQPALAQMSEVARELFQSIGLTVDYQAMDWGSVVTRRANQAPLDQGGWGCFITVMSPLTAANPGSMLSLRGNGRKGGSAGRPMSGSSNCARPGSTRRTWRRRSRSPKRFSFDISRACHSWRCAGCCNRWRSGRISRTWCGPRSRSSGG
jgi:peptide/nickel transport system substrate-binding protein